MNNLIGETFHSRNLMSFCVVEHSRLTFSIPEDNSFTLSTTLDLVDGAAKFQRDSSSQRFIAVERN